MKFELLHSQAFKNLKYGHAVKLLIWMHEKIKIEPIKGKRGKNRFQVINGGQFSFLYREAEWRGLSKVQFSKSIKDLHKFGFIDVVKVGSALKGDFSIYKLSERWKKYGTHGFLSVVIPRPLHKIEAGFEIGHIKYGRAPVI